VENYKKYQINQQKNHTNYKNKKNNLINIFRENSYLFGIYIFTSVIILAAWLQPFVEPSFLVRDIFALSSTPVYFGILSNIGIFIWLATGAITIFSGTILFSVNKEKNWSLFLILFGLLTMILAIDDFFMLHEDFFPILLKIPEKLILLTYGLMMLSILVKFKKIVLHNHLKTFIVTISFLALSIIADQILPDKAYLLKPGDNFLLEDGLKLVGIVSWSFYLIKMSQERLQSYLKS
jgi:hypothetical protein